MSGTSRGTFLADNSKYFAGSATALALKENVSWSISFWVYVTSTPGNATYGLTGVGDWGGTGSMYNIESSYQQSVELRHVQSRITDAATYNTTVRGPENDWQAGQWHHIVFAQDGSTKKVIMYDNGVAGTESTAHVSVSDNVGTPLLIGKNPSANGGLDWLIDEYSVWNYCLSAADVNALYNSGNGLFYPLSNSAPDVNSVKLDGFDSNSQGLYFKRDTNHVISARVSDDVFVNKATIKLIGDSNYTVITDLNVMNAYVHPTIDVNCSAFPGVNGCTLSFDLNALLLSVPDGNYAIDVNVGDISGLWKANQTQRGYYIDANAPTTTDNHSPWHNTNQTITLTCTDKGSGCSATEYRIDSGAWNGYTTPFTLTTDGNHRIDYYSVDNLTQVENTHSIWTAIDTNSPTGFDDHNASWQTHDANVIIGCVDGVGESGCNLTHYSLSNGQYPLEYSQDGNIRAIYHFNNNLIDASGNNYTATYEGTPNYSNSTTKIGPQSAGKLYDSNYITLPDAVLRNMKTGTIEFWLYIQENPTAGDKQTQILSRAGGQWIYRCSYASGCDQNKLKATWHNGTDAYLQSTTTINIRTWYHIALTFNGENTKLYINGIEEDSDTGTPNPDSTSENDISSSTTDELRGYIDELAVNNAAKTSFNITQTWHVTPDKNILIQDKNMRVDYGVTDNAGNDSNYTMWVAVDKAPPTTIDDHNSGWQKGNADIRLTCTDTTSGCNTTKFRKNLGAWTTYTPGNILITTDGNHRIDYNSTDVAGNIEITKSIWIARDSNYGGHPGIDANYNYAYTTQSYLDQDAGINTVTISFTDTTDFNNLTTRWWRWDENNTAFSNDQNTTRNYTTQGDRNTCLTSTVYYPLLDSNYTSKKCYTITIVQKAQSIDFNYTIIKTTDQNITIRLQADANTTGATFTWLLNGTHLISGQDINHTFHLYGDQNICVTSTNIDQNKTKCVMHEITMALIKVPKDEKTLVDLNGYSIGIDTNAANYATSIQSDKNIFWFNSLQEKTIKNILIDYNADYFKRYYFVTTDGKLYVIQPYLLQKVNSGAVTIYAKELTTNQSLPNTSITVKKFIGGIKTIVEQQSTDSAGVAVFSFIFNDTYYIDANYNGLGFVDQILRPTTTAYSIYINTLKATPSTPGTSYTFDANFQPGNTIIKVDGSGTINLGSTIFSNGAYISAIKVTITQDANILFDINTNNGGVPFKIYTPPIPDISTGGLTPGHAIVFDITITDIEGNTKTISHTIAYLDTGTMDLSINFSGLSSILGETGSAYLSILIAICIVGLTIGLMGNHPSVSIVGGMVFLILGVFGMFPITLAIIACVFGFAMYYLRAGV
jgi:hypothetical protein